MNVKSVISGLAVIALLMGLSITAQAEQRAFAEKPNAVEVKTKVLNIKVPAGSSAKDIERAIQKALKKDNYKLGTRDLRKIQSNARLAARKGLEKRGNWTIRFRIFRRYEIVISGGWG